MKGDADAHGVGMRRGQAPTLYDRAAMIRQGVGPETPLGGSYAFFWDGAWRGGKSYSSGCRWGIRRI